MHQKVTNGFEGEGTASLAFYCLADVYPKQPARMIVDLDALMAIMRVQTVQINMMYRVFPEVAAVSVVSFLLIHYSAFSASEAM